MLQYFLRSDLFSLKINNGLYQKDFITIGYDQCVFKFKLTFKENHYDYILDKVYVKCTKIILIETKQKQIDYIKDIIKVSWNENTKLSNLLEIKFKVTSENTIDDSVYYTLKVTHLTLEKRL